MRLKGLTLSFTTILFLSGSIQLFSAEPVIGSAQNKKLLAEVERENSLVAEQIQRRDRERLPASSKKSPKKLRKQNKL